MGKIIYLGHLIGSINFDYPKSSLYPDGRIRMMSPGRCGNCIWYDGKICLLNKSIGGTEISSQKEYHDRCSFHAKRSKIMKEPKQYQINTVQDMIDATNKDNLQTFLIDLEGLLVSAHSMRDLIEGIAKNKGEFNIKAPVRVQGFTWIDDGKHNAEITIERHEKERI